ncbi:transcriptional regulator [Spirochaetia bacterium]|nr:transcriptional regulator [Spirochaetia bacterium]
MILHDAKTFGAAVKSYRKQQGVNQTQLAGVSGTGLRFISELENGKPTVQLDKALRVAKILGMNIECGDPKCMTI